MAGSVSNWVGSDAFFVDSCRFRRIPTISLPTDSSRKLRGNFRRNSVDFQSSLVGIWRNQLAKRLTEYVRKEISGTHTDPTGSGQPWMTWDGCFRIVQRRSTANNLEKYVRPCTTPFYDARYVNRLGKRLAASACAWRSGLENLLRYQLQLCA